MTRENHIGQYIVNIPSAAPICQDARHARRSVSRFHPRQHDPGRAAASAGDKASSRERGERRCGLSDRGDAGKKPAAAALLRLRLGRRPVRWRAICSTSRAARRGEERARFRRGLGPGRDRRAQGRRAGADDRRRDRASPPPPSRSMPRRTGCAIDIATDDVIGQRAALGCQARRRHVLRAAARRAPHRVLLLAAPRPGRAGAARRSGPRLSAPRAELTALASYIVPTPPDPRGPQRARNDSMAGSAVRDHATGAITSRRSLQTSTPRADLGRAGARRVRVAG